VSPWIYLFIELLAIGLLIVAGSLTSKDNESKEAVALFFVAIALFVVPIIIFLKN
jgi:hypothetical protein